MLATCIVVVAATALAAQRAQQQQRPAAASPQPLIVQVVADDLGYNDLGYANGGKTHTPHIDAAVQQGIKLTAYHTYKVCAPTRASLM